MRRPRRRRPWPASEIDFSLFTDGLAAEREQGITIDVAYRYFATERRKFIVADTPGHVQYTRNMVTGASTADVGVILIDARLGVLEQSRRHAYIASLLGIPHLSCAVNKMDLRGYDAAGLRRPSAPSFTRSPAALGFRDVTFVPVSALRGENVVQPATAMPWYDGPTVLGFLERVPIAEDRNLARLPLSRAVRAAPEPRLPRLLRADRLGRGAKGRRGAWCCRRRGARACAPSTPPTASAPRLRRPRA